MAGLAFPGTCKVKGYRVRPTTSPSESLSSRDAYWCGHNRFFDWPGPHVVVGAEEFADPGVFFTDSASVVCGERGPG